MEQAAERIEARDHAAVPVATLVLAAAGAVLLGIGDVVVGLRNDTADAVFLLTGILGWALVAWSTMMAGISLVSIVRRASTRRTVTRLEVALIAASVVLVAVLLVTHPLWGSGSASA